MLPWGCRAQTPTAQMRRAGLWFVAVLLGSRLSASRCPPPPSTGGGTGFAHCAGRRGARGRHDRLQPGPGAPPHSPGETSRGCWRAVFCPAVAEGNPQLTFLEKTTHVAALGWEWEREGAQAMQSRRPPPAPGPFFTPAAPRVGRGNSSQAPQKGWGLHVVLCHPHPPPGPWQPPALLRPKLLGSHEKQQAVRGSGKH